MGKSELSLQRKMIDMFQLAGYGAKAPQRYETELGQPDVFVAMGRIILPVEVKYARSTFSFSQWKPEQREWALWYWAVHGVAVHIAIFSGSSPVTSVSQKALPTRLWITPFHYWIQIEDIMKGRGRNSIPYRAPATQSGYDLVSMIPDRFQYKYRDGGFAIGPENMWSDGGILSTYNQVQTLERWRTARHENKKDPAEKENTV